MMIKPPARVTLFMPCLGDLFYPSLGRAVIKVLRRAGLEVDYPEDQTCCGQWAFNLGRDQAARGMARHFLRVFGRAEAVVAPSGSCVLTVRDHYPELFAHDTEIKKLAEDVGRRTFELTDFLVNVLGAADLGAEFPGRVTLHDSCHPLRGLGLKDEPRRLLAEVSGLELVEMADPELCCGFGGAFMAHKAPLSKAMADAKVDQAAATGADWLIMTEPGCLLNVKSAAEGRGMPLKVIHLAEVLASGGKDQDVPEE